MRELAQHQLADDDAEEDDFNAEIIITDRGFCAVSLLDDYAYRGSSFAQYCLYDYCAQFYKRKKLNGLFFDAHHPQHAHYGQFLRKDSAIISTLLGKLLFVKPDSKDEKKNEDLLSHHLYVLPLV